MNFKSILLHGSFEYLFDFHLLYLFVAIDGLVYFHVAILNQCWQSEDVDIWVYRSLGYFLLTC